MIRLKFKVPCKYLGNFYAVGSFGYVQERYAKRVVKAGLAEEAPEVWEKNTEPKKEAKKKAVKKAAKKKAVKK